MTLIVHTFGPIRVRANGLAAALCGCGFRASGRSAEMVSSHLLWHVRWMSGIGVELIGA